MKQVYLPGSDLVVSQLCFGCWGIVSDFHWGDRDEAESTAAIQAARQAGVTFFDTAEMYGEGASESLLGKVLAGERDQVVIATKMRPDSMRPDQVGPACERSLRRLNTDYIDLYQTHWTDPTIPLADTWEAMLRLREQGKVRAVGVCNAGPADLDAVCASAVGPATNQLPLNLLWRAIEQRIVPRCQQHHVGVLAYSPLMHGLLSDRYQSAAEVPDGRARSRHFHTRRSKARHGEEGCEELTFSTIAAIRQISHDLGRTMADIALSWVAQQPGVSAVIAGVRNADQLRDNLATLDRPLPSDGLQQLTAATDRLKQVLGPNPDMWQGSQSSRYR